MKNLEFILISILLFTSLALSAQTQLSDSQRESSEFHIYKLNHKNLQEVYLKEEGVDESMLHTYVASCAKRADIPNLPRGNYALVKVVENKLNFSDYTVDDFHFKLVPNEKIILCLYDSLGNIIEDAIVKRGSKKLQYDKNTKTYSISKVNDEQIIEINNKGVYHYIEFQDSNYFYNQNFFEKRWNAVRNTWFKIKSGVVGIFNSEARSGRNKYSGFIVFSKPKYKPNEIVKLKAHISKHNGKPYNNEISLHLGNNYYPESIDTLLTTLAPYSPGLFEYQFQLDEGLKLQLDKNYNIILKTKNKRDGIHNSFKYEEYELKGTLFTATTSKENYVKGDSVKLKLKVTDENYMAVYDGRVEIKLTSVQPKIFQIYNSEDAFIPDVIWEETIDMNGIFEKEVLLPDSLFVNNVSLSYTIESTFLSADNEKKTERTTIYYDVNDYVIDFSLSKGMLTIRELYKGNSQTIKALVTFTGEDDEIILQDSLILPHTLAIPWMVHDVQVETVNSNNNFFSDEDIKEDMLDSKFYRRNDSIYLKVDNPAKIPFWYTIRKQNKIIANGYVTTLDYLLKDKRQDGYSMQIVYLFRGNEKTIGKTLPFEQKNITIDVVTPLAVYPGQTAKVAVSVKDLHGKPVKNADITAYAFSSKFGNHIPNMTIHRKGRYAKHFKNAAYYVDEDFYQENTYMTWEKWKYNFALDSIEYYKFLYPKPYYLFAEPNDANMTQIASFVVIDGHVEGVQMLWIDNVLHYAKQAEQQNIYSFPISAGLHNIRMRTYDREVEILNIPVTEGLKTIISVDGKQNTVRNSTEMMEEKPIVTIVRKLPKNQIGLLSHNESKQLEKELISINPNWGEITAPHKVKFLPAYINAGGLFYSIDSNPRTKYDNILRTHIKLPTLIGPFPYKHQWGGSKNIASLYVDSLFVSNFEIEGGYEYTIYKDYLKQKSWDAKPFDYRLSNFKQNVNLKQTALTKESILENARNNFIADISNIKGLAVYHNSESKGGCRLSLLLKNMRNGKNNVSPKLILFSSSDSLTYLYYGATRQFNNLPAGKSVMTLVFSDSTSYSHSIDLKEKGQNYLYLDSLSIIPLDYLAQSAIDTYKKSIHKNFILKPKLSTLSNDSLVVALFQEVASYSAVNTSKGSITGVVRDASGELLMGVAVMAKGANVGTYTDIDGRFYLSGVENGELEFTYIGFKTTKTKLRKGYDYNIVLKEDAMHLDEVVVLGYGNVSKKSLTFSTTQVTSDRDYYSEEDLAMALSGRIPGIAVGASSNILIRGVSTKTTKPLIIVNGLPFDGDLSEIYTSSILSLNILKDASYTAIYGSRAAAGVIFIQTNAAPIVSNLEEVTGEEKGNSIRRNFHDDAFWQPKLRTNDEGKASFDVAYPDNVTSWNANFIAIGGRKQTDTKQLTIKSFKSLTARLSVPQFAIRGDSISVIGKLVNYFSDSVNVQRTIEVDGRKEVLKVIFEKSHIDKIPIVAEESDSIKVTYSLLSDNGYFDGEENSIPILEQGVLETHGEFKVINDQEAHIFTLNPSLGKTKIYAHISSLDVFFNEIERIENYPYASSEHMASNIKALLSKKQLLSTLNIEFKDGKKINKLISNLNKNRNREGLWGWWKQSNTEFWITKQVVEALFKAEKEGYKTNFDKQFFIDKFKSDLDNSLSSIPSLFTNEQLRAKEGLLDILIFLQEMDAPINYESYFVQISELEDNSITDKLKSAKLKLAIGLTDEVKADSLLKCSSKTTLGSIFWKDNNYRRYAFLPQTSDVQTTLIAYNLFKELGGYEKELEQIRNYFFEQRQNGLWKNAFESSSIMETILPDLIDGAKEWKEVNLMVNDEKISKFPYEGETNEKEIRVVKQGSPPLFFTLHQETRTNSPSAESKGFDITTSFVENKQSTNVLSAGKSIELEVEVDVKSDANYAVIEVPIPAGCSYESKIQSNYYSKEVHREYFKDKVSIFCYYLTKGKHLFTIKLIPRYSGIYHINPAKVELMYFPTFYGRESSKSIKIE